MAADAECTTPRNPRRRSRAEAEALAWVGSALRTERVLRRLEARHRTLPR